MEQALDETPNVYFHDAHPSVESDNSDVIGGLQSRQKFIDPKWFYDETGSELFEQITRVPEYYPTRTERDILQQNRRAISEHCGQGCVFIEPGAGSCAKARLLLDTLRPRAYVPLDISADFMRDAALQLGREYPWLQVQAICADFNDDWELQGLLPEGKRTVFYPGSTIGNLEPADAMTFLHRVRTLIGEDGGLLIGVDLHKSSSRLQAAYNDAQGLTARFNLNMLTHLNDELGADFDTQQFKHHAFYNTDKRRVEMHLVSERDQSVRLNGEQIDIAPGESIHTENSYKYTVEDFGELAAAAGMEIVQSWFDDDALFSVHYLAPSTPGGQ